MWTNQAAVFDALTPPMQELLLGLTAVHTAAVFGEPDVEAEHPVVRRHPETGERSLFVNRQFTQRIVQLRPEESEALLSFLYRFSEQPQFTVRYPWTPGTVGIWDNRITQHYVGERLRRAADPAPGHGARRRAPSPPATSPGGTPGRRPASRRPPSPADAPSRGRRTR